MKTSFIVAIELFDFTKNNKTYFINTELNSEQEKILGSWTEKIVNFYENKFKIPYGNSVTYLYTKPISKRNAWMFVTYPTIAIIGQEKYNVKSVPTMVLLENGEEVRRSVGYKDVTQTNNFING